MRVCSWYSYPYGDHMSSQGRIISCCCLDSSHRKLVTLDFFEQNKVKEEAKRFLFITVISYVIST